MVNGSCSHVYKEEITMLKVLFGSWVGIASIGTIILTIIVISYWIGFCILNARKERENSTPS